MSCSCKVTKSTVKAHCRSSAVPYHPQGAAGTPILHCCEEGEYHQTSLSNAAPKAIPGGFQHDAISPANCDCTVPVSCATGNAPGTFCG